MGSISVGTGSTSQPVRFQPSQPLSRGVNNLFGKADSMYTDNTIWQWYITLTLLCGAATGLIGTKCGGSGLLWFIVGVVLGPFALPLPFMLAGRECPYCCKGISVHASICPYCRTVLTAGKAQTASAPEQPKSSGLFGPIVIGGICVLLIFVLLLKSH